MRPIEANTTPAGARRAWGPPTVTKLAIGRQTKSGCVVTAGFGPTRLVAPQPPAAPASKLGFSLEWAFPLSARIE